jgi:hypothetical protein
MIGVDMVRWYDIELFDVKGDAAFQRIPLGV